MHILYSFFFFFSAQQFSASSAHFICAFFLPGKHVVFFAGIKMFFAFGNIFYENTIFWGYMIIIFLNFFFLLLFELLYTFSLPHKSFILGCHTFCFCYTCHSSNKVFFIICIIGRYICISYIYFWKFTLIQQI